MNIKKIVFSSILLFTTFFSFSADISKKIKIDFQFNTKSPDPKNYLNWSTDTEKYKDSFDAVSGASKKHSTKELRTAFTDTSDKNFYAPKGLRALLLFAVSSEKYLESDKPQIIQEGKKISISFTHREVEYKIISDENGVFSVPESFFIKTKKSEPPKEAEKSESPAPQPQEKPQEQNLQASEKAPEPVSPEDEANPSSETSSEPAELQDKTTAQNKIPEGFAQDAPAKDETKYSGRLSASFTGNILKITGKLKLIPKKIDG
ncbi:MAG: hypothetical protein KBT11_07510 [Treponema sp.]|nr:hypothetical protein [Candidatus Treponema equifaecale]